MAKPIGISNNFTIRFSQLESKKSIACKLLGEKLSQVVANLNNLRQ